MKASFVPLLLLMGGCSMVRSTQFLPSELVGEWATKGAEFGYGGVGISSGAAIYLKSDGHCAVVGAPPPIGYLCHSSYDAQGRILTIVALEDGKEMGSFRTRYDGATQSLRCDSQECKEAVYFKRGNDLPKYVLESME